MEAPGRAEECAEGRAAALTIYERDRGKRAALRPSGAIRNASFVPAHGLRFAVGTRLRSTRGYSPPPLRGESGGGEEIHHAESIFGADPCLLLIRRAQVRSENAFQSRAVLSPECLD